jgi:sugar phosphate isomerase/epimerase
MQTADRAFKLGYSTIGWGPEPDLDLVLGTISEAGYEGVEFISVATDWLGTPARLRRLTDEHGLAPVCFFGSVDLGSPETERAQLERQRRLIEYAAEVGAPTYAFLGGKRVHQRFPTDHELRRLGEVGEKLVDHAAPLGLAVVYHAHPLCTVESEAEQDRMLAHAPRVQLCLDVSVSALMGEDPLAQIRKYGRRIGYVHMKDWARGKFVPMGQGTVGLDFGRVRETLNEIGYRGWVMGELSSYADHDAAEACRRNMDYLRSVGY